MAKPKLTNEDYCRTSKRLKCEVAAIKAVASVESAGNGFYDDGFPVILFERHLFRKFTQGRYNSTYPEISGAQGGYGGVGPNQRRKFSLAFSLNPDAAMKACSWGKFQILGSNYAVCGYNSVGAFVDAMKESEGKQLDAFVAFVIGNSLDDNLRGKDWAGFARGYNGPAYKTNKYDSKMASAYTRFKNENIDCSKVSAANGSPSTMPDPLNLASNADAIKASPKGAQSEPPQAGEPAPPKIPIASVPVPVIEVPVLQAATTEAQADTKEESTLTKIGNRANAIYTTFAALISAAISWLAGASTEIIYSVAAAVIFLGSTHMYLNYRRAENKDIRDREDAKLAADRELQLKILREQHTQEAQLYSMKTAADPNLAAVTLASPPPAIEVPNSDSAV